MQRPSKFAPPQKEPLCFEREIKFFRNDKNNYEFGNSSHTAWEKFQKTVRSPDYQRVITGRKYRELTPINGDWSFKKLDPVYKR